MTSHIRNLIERFSPKGPDRILIAGLDYTGKTTLLYFLKLGEIVQTISTLGFNVETVDIPVASGSKLKLEIWEVGSGCGGVRTMALMLRHYTPTSKAIVWTVDAGDKTRLEESVEALRSVLQDAEHEAGDSTARVPVLILGTKSETNNTLSVDDIRKAFAPVTNGRIAAVYNISIKSQPPKGLTDAFSWLGLGLEIAANVKPGAPPPEVPMNVLQPREPSVLAKRLDSWLRRVDDDLAPEDFVAKFNAYDLPSWDHYTHIRIGYLLLMAHGRQKGKDMIFEGLANYIANNAQTNGRAFHVSMTYFWIQIIHFGIRNMPPSLVEHAKEDTGVPSYPSPGDFFRFLLVNPHVEVIMSAEAKANMVLPDKKPLPSLVIRDAITSFGSK
ncbi:hypothetical protein FA15DRAFT_687363 [Coprinopsis marcescibilis]|uniref:ADP-ribosylation factor n=1 Tax=Coprinopsis marcescibilis TaxID=230819 RepID=A0A5C3KW66_COPMA|nr:hypothetical protein FA15DRAFT_687363 [Coprinopsis marcescibilis]